MGEYMIDGGVTGWRERVSIVVFLLLAAAFLFFGPLLMARAAASQSEAILEYCPG